MKNFKLFISENFLESLSVKTSFLMDKNCLCLQRASLEDFWDQTNVHLLININSLLLGRRLKTQKQSQFHGSLDLVSKSRIKLSPPSMSDRCLAGSPKVKLAGVRVLPIDQILTVKLFWWLLLSQSSSLPKYALGDLSDLIKMVPHRSSLSGVWAN